MRLLFVERDGRIGFECCPAGQRQRIRSAAIEVAVGEFRQDAFRDGPSVFFQCNREIHRQAVVTWRDVRTPTHPGNHVTAFHQEAVAEIARSHRVVHVRVRCGVVHAAEGNLASAVVDFEKQGFRTQFHVHRLEDHHVGGEFDLAGFVQRRAVDIEYGLVPLHGRIDFEPCPAGQFFVGPGVAK